MKELLKTQTVSGAHGIRIALAAVGIEATVSGEHSVGVLGGGFSVLVLHDEDVEKARREVAKLRMR